MSQLKIFKVETTVGTFLVLDTTTFGDNVRDKVEKEFAANHFGSARPTINQITLVADSQPNRGVVKLLT